MAEENTTATKLKAEDRVKRKDGLGCQGTVLEVRAEVTSTKSDIGSKALMVVVKWDNGVQSYFTPAALDRV